MQRTHRSNRNFATGCVASGGLALLLSACGLRAWVGAQERPAFITQTQALAQVWAGLGADIAAIQAPEQHHFNVIDALADPDSAMVADWLGA